MSKMMICPKAKECDRECTDKIPHPKSKGCRDKRLYPTFSDGSVCPACIEYVEPQPAYECTAPEMQGVCLAIIPNEEHCKECTSWQPKKPATKTSRDARFRSMERFLSPTLNLGERLPPQPEEPAGLKPEPKCNASFCNSKMNGYCTTPNECGFKVKPEMPLREKEQIELLDLMCKGNIEGLEPDEVTKLISLWYRWYKEQQQARDTEVRQEIVKECTKVQPDIDVPPNFKPGTDEFFVYCQGANDYWLSIQAHIENKAREATNV